MSDQDKLRDEVQASVDSWLKMYVEMSQAHNIVAREALYKLVGSLVQAELADIHEPMACGHPKACWVPGQLIFDAIDELNVEKSTQAYCLVCKELAARDETIRVMYNALQKAKLSDGLS